MLGLKVKGAIAVLVSSSYPAMLFTFNALRATCFIGNMKLYLQFVSFLHIDMT